MSSKAFIPGQEGAYLAKFPLGKGYSSWQQAMSHLLNAECHDYLYEGPVVKMCLSPTYSGCFGKTA